MRSVSDHINIDEITSFQTILAALTELESIIYQNKLKQFVVFNKAYFIVTSAIKQASDEGYFKNPEFVERFTICFASYYFQAVNATIGNNPDLPAAWDLTGMACQYKNTPNFILLLMGANAHINHDFPLALYELIGAKEPSYFVKDVLKIDKLLMKSGRQIVTTFEESNKLLDLVKRRFIFLYYRPIMYMVLYWRVKAWRNYKSIKKHGLKGSDYTKTSTKTAKRFLKLAKYFQG